MGFQNSDSDGFLKKVAIAIAIVIRFFRLNRALNRALDRALDRALNKAFS